MPTRAKRALVWAVRIIAVAVLAAGGFAYTRQADLLAAFLSGGATAALLGLSLLASREHPARGALGSGTRGPV